MCVKNDRLAHRHSRRLRLEKYRFSIAWSESDGEYVATSAEFRGLSGLGATAEDAVRELRAAMEVAIAAFTEDGEPVPEAQHLDQFSGQFRLRLPRSQHALLVARAQTEGVSLNALVQTYVTAGLTGDNWASRTAQRLDVSLGQAARMLTREFENWSAHSGNAFAPQSPSHLVSSGIPTPRIN
jgi:antitoxin HicB